MLDLNLNPYILRITDPLTQLDKRRQFLVDRFDKFEVPPIYVMKDDEDYLVYNGNKRTIIARELFRNLHSLLISNDSDLFEAQEKEPRKLPSELTFDYISVLNHLRKRARQYGQLNYSLFPVERSTAFKIMNSSRRLTAQPNNL